MTGKSLSSSFLRLISADPQSAACYPLLPHYSIEIGRDPSCQIVLDSVLYGMVSRRHALIRPVAGSSGDLQWEICDLNSANGTYVNGQRLLGCRSLQLGDRILLGQNGPEFLLDRGRVPPAEGRRPTSFSEPEASPTPALSAVVSSEVQLTPKSPREEATFSQLFPIFSTGRDLPRKAYLLPGIVTVSCVVLMFASVGDAMVFNVLLAGYLASAAYYFVYQLCGKHKPWWLLVGVMGAMVLLLTSPVLPVFLTVFREILPGRLPVEGEVVSFPMLLVRMFFGAGLMEEILKSLPVLVLWWLGRQLRSPWRDRIGIWEPLDGILVGCAAAVGFTLLETLDQYVPSMIESASTADGSGELLGLQLLIPRILGSIAGHMAYSGYLGYFIGLSVLKPANRWSSLTVGYLSAAGLHALWNTTGVVSGLILAVVGVVSYAFLGAAILKARALSPTRSQNFATQFSRRSRR